MAKKYANFGKVIYATTWESASQYWAQFRDATTGLGTEFGSMVLVTDASGNATFEARSSFSSATGDVNGPASSTDNAVVRFNGTTGKSIQNSGVIVDDSNNVTGVVALTATGVVTATNASNVIRIGTSCDVTTPPAIGGTTPNTGKFSTLWATGTLRADGDVTFNADVYQVNDGSLAGSTITTYSDTANASQIYQQKARGSLASPAIVQTDDFLSNYRSDAYDGVQFVRVMSQRVRVEGTPTAGDTRGRMVWAAGKFTAPYTDPTIESDPNDDPEDPLMTLTASNANPRLGMLDVTGDISVRGISVGSGGIVSTALSSTTSVVANIDTDNNSTSEVFAVRSNGSGTNQFSVSEDGNIMGLGILTLGSGPTTVTDAAGKVLSAALNTVAVAQGGSGAVTLTGLLQGNGTSAFTAITDSTTVGQVLRVTGSNTYAWGALSLSTAAAITGTLPVGSGGTGATTFTANGVLYGNTTSAVQVTAQGAANSVLTANAGAPAFSATPRVDALGIGVATASTRSLNILSDFTDAANGSVYNMVSGTSRLTANSATTVEGLRLNHTVVPAFNNTGTYMGARFIGATSGSGTGTMTAIRATSALITNVATSPITSAYAYYAETGSNAGGATIGTMAGMFIANQNVGTNNRGLWLGQSTTGTNNFALYQDTPSVKSYFAGLVGIGTTSGAYPLHVVGESRLLGNTTFGNASTDTITCTGRLIPRTIGSGSVALNEGEIAYRSGNWYGANAATGTYTPIRFLTSADLLPALSIPRTLNVNTTEASISASTSETTLGSYTVPGSTLASTGDRIEYYAACAIQSDAGESCTVRIKFGSTTLFTIAPSVNANATIHIHVTIIRTGAATQKIMASASTLANLGDLAAYTTATETLSGDLALVLTGQISLVDGTDNKVTHYTSTTTYFPV